MSPGGRSESGLREAHSLAPLEITEAGDYYLVVSTAWILPRNRWSIRTTGELNIEQFTQNTQPSISSVSVSDITRTSAKFTVVVSNSWVNRVYVKTVNESGSTAYPSKLTSAAGAGQSDTLVFDTTVRSDRPLIAGATHTVSVSTTSDFSSNVVTRTCYGSAVGVHRGPAAWRHLQSGPTPCRAVQTRLGGADTRGNGGLVANVMRLRTAFRNRVATLEGCTQTIRPEPLPLQRADCQNRQPHLLELRRFQEIQLSPSKEPPARPGR